ncbi:MAG: hypothetical protein IK123_09850, partial [Lachnospiraceae bacterium]|nr:hypothetical protein [Lachnospiraceae bacterium]
RLTDINPVIKEMLEKYRNPEKGRFLTVKHNLTEEPADNIKARILYCLYVLIDFFFRSQTEYKIMTIIGFVNNRYLIKYEFKFMESLIKEFEESLNSHGYHMLKSYVEDACSECEFAPTETGLEIRIIVA